MPDSCELSHLRPTAAEIDWNKEILAVAWSASRQHTISAIPGEGMFKAHPFAYSQFRSLDRSSNFDCPFRRQRERRQRMHRESELNASARQPLVLPSRSRDRPSILVLAPENASQRLAFVAKRASSAAPILSMANSQILAQMGSARAVRAGGAVLHPTGTGRADANRSAIINSPPSVGWGGS